MDIKLIRLAGGLLCAAGGALIGYVVAHKALETEYSDLATHEIAEAKSYLNHLYKNAMASTLTNKGLQKRVPKDPEGVGGPRIEVMQRIAEGLRRDAGVAEGIVQKQRYGPRDVVVKDPDEVVHTNVLEDVRKAAKKGKVAGPVVISEVDYMTSDLGYVQVNLTYFEGDDTLMDGEEHLVDDATRLIGEDWKEKFGYMANDDNVVYVRNARMNIDYEVSRSKGTYKFEVLGDEDD